MATDDDEKGKKGRIGLAACATLYTFFFVGALFGWGPMQRLLESSGAFHSTCLGEDGVCQAQSTTIINVNFIAICTNTLTPLIGSAIDHFGAIPVATYFMSPCALAGSALLAVAAWQGQLQDAPYDLDWLYYVAFCLLGLSTYAGSLLNVQVGLYFSGTTQVRIIMFLNALFDAGSVTYLLLWGLQVVLGFSFFHVTVIYFALAILCYGGGAYFWNSAVPEGEDMAFIPDEEDEGKALVHEPGRRRTSGASGSRGASGLISPYSSSLRGFQIAHMDNANEMDHLLAEYRESLGMGNPAPVPARTSNNSGYGATTSPPIEEGKVSNIGLTTTAKFGPDQDGYILVSERAPKDQLLSLPFMMMTFFFAINMISTNWSLTTAADFLASLGDNGTYLSIFTLLQPCSILALPIVDATVQKLGFGTAFQMVNVLGFIYISIKLFSPSLHVQVIHAVLVAMVRCFLFAVTFSFLPSLLGPEVVGKGTGILYLIGGVFSFVNIPLAGLTTGEGGFFLTNAMYLCATIPTSIMACYLDRTIKREDKIRGISK